MNEAMTTTFDTNTQFEQDMQAFIGTVPQDACQSLEHMLNGDVLHVVMQHVLEGKAHIVVRFYGIPGQDDAEDEYAFDPVPDHANSSIEAMQSAVFEWLTREGDVMFYAPWPGSDFLYYLGKMESYGLPWEIEDVVNTLMGLHLIPDQEDNPAKVAVR